MTLAGKKVAVLGTGASAIQIVPTIQPEVDELHVFQRTPPWVVPHSDRPITNFERRVFRRFPAIQRRVRRNVYWLRELLAIPMTRRPGVLKALERRAVAHMKKSIKDPELQRKLTPDYRIGCKRILPSNQWYPALAKPNVNVVTEGIAEIKPEGIVTADGTLHECDVIVHATGFHVTDIPFAKRVFGRDGRSLHDVWSGSPQAYKGTAVPGYPNLFFLLGPNTGLGHNSIVHMIESQIAYVVDALRKMRSDGVHALRRPARGVPVLERRPSAKAAAHGVELRRVLELVHRRERAEHHDLARLHMALSPPDAEVRRGRLRVRIVAAWLGDRFWPASPCSRWQRCRRKRLTTRSSTARSRRRVPTIGTPRQR